MMFSLCHTARNTDAYCLAVFIYTAKMTFISATAADSRRKTNTIGKIWA